jgi:hypothetical protein
MLLDRILSFFTSLRLTVFCLACALVLVFAGTLAQVHLGLYATQERYFHSLFVTWTPQGTHLRIPVWPGGYLLGGLLLVNLIAAHIKRFSLSPKKIGLFMIHAGLILLFLGQFLTEMFQIESFMRIEEGETKSYSESGRQSELAIVDVSNPSHDSVVAIPESMVARKGEITRPELPFTIRVKQYFANSAPAPAMKSVAGDIKTISATHGIGERLRLQPRDITTRMDDDNVPAALVEIATPQGVLGSWTVSDWFNRNAAALREIPKFSEILDTPQEFTYQNKTYRIALRPVRYYKPYQMTLLKFVHKRYKGTEIPKDFSSRIQLKNPQTGENREVRIFMNNPLRYAGETYYQGGYQGDTVTILQVVRNPAWLTPYLSCTLVGLGLTVHFLMHLINFGKRRAQASSAGSGTRSEGSPKVSAQPKRPKAKAQVEPAVAALGTVRAVANSLQTAKRRST